MTRANTGTVQRRSLHGTCAVRCAFGCALLCYALAAVSGVAAQAGEDPTRDASARALFQEGLGLAEHSDWLAAEDRFRRAYTLRASPVIAYNLATALAERGKLVEASEFLRKVQQDDKADASLKQSARTLQTELAGHIGRITIVARDKQPSDRVLLDANPLLEVQLGVEIPIDPGEHSVSLQRGDREVDMQTLQVAANGSEHVTLIAPSVPSPNEVAGASQYGSESAAPLAVTQADHPVDNGAAPITSRWWFWTGVGVVAVGAIALVAVAANGGNSSKTETAYKGDLGPGTIMVRVGQ